MIPSRMLLAMFCLLAALCACSHTAPQPLVPVHSKAKLIVEQPTLTPGSQANLGIQFVTESGWHIYWQNPGDSGEPPRIQWRLPAGITAGTLEWPTPTRMTTTAGTDYGYQGTTVLLSTLHIPATTQPGTTLELVGDLRWLVCHDICVPQHTQLKAPIRIASAASIDHSAQQALQTATERIPQPLPESFRPSAAELPGAFRLTLISAQPISQAQFFPGEEEQIDNSAPQSLTNRAGTTSLTLKKSEYLRKDPERLRGVILLNGRDAYQLDVPIQTSAMQKQNKRSLHS
jgi:DsbC/DsbD-like thiol-disulfide interchange protein